MGTDVYSETGIIKTLPQMIQAFPKEGLKLIAAAVNRYIKTKVEPEYQDNFLDLTDFQGNYREYTQALYELSRIHNDEIDHNDENDFYDPGYEYDHTGHILNIWRIIMKSAHPQLPIIQEIRVFDNPREVGYNVPINTPVFIFPTNKMFKQVLTKKGNQFKKVFGDCKQTTWTILSY